MCANRFNIKMIKVIIYRQITKIKHTSKTMSLQLAAVNKGVFEPNV